MIEITAYKSGFAQQHRYIFALYPFLFLLVVAPLSMPRGGLTGIVQWTLKFGVIMTVVASLWIAPHWLGAFNLVSGGNSRGHWHLYNDATDWGQDAYFVAEWIQSHPNHRPLKWVPLGMHWEIDPVVYNAPPGIDGPHDPNRKWVIVSKSELSVDPHLQKDLPDEPVQAIGASHFLYRVEP